MIKANKNPPTLERLDFIVINLNSEHVKSSRFTCSCYRFMVEHIGNESPKDLAARQLKRPAQTLGRIPYPLTMVFE